MVLDLYRIQPNKRATPGVLVVDGLPMFVTMEPPWKDNKVDISCIPPGNYVCKKVTHEKFKETLLVMDVPYRSGIYFHSLNLPTETEGCIGLGMWYGDVKLKGMEQHERGIRWGPMAMQILRNNLKGIDNIELRIHEVS